METGVPHWLFDGHGLVSLLTTASIMGAGAHGLLGSTKTQVFRILSSGLSTWEG